MNLNSLKSAGPWTLGEIDGNWREIDLPRHGGVMRIVWKMEDDERGSPACEALAHEVIAKLNASTSQAPVAAALTDTYVQEVPDKCDRIVWRNRYYHLPISQQQAAPTVAWGYVDELGEPQPAIRYWAITGRIPGKDEDTCHVLRAATREEAIEAFKEMMLDGWTEEDRDSVFRSHGQCVFINSVCVSDAPIEEA